MSAPSETVRMLVVEDDGDRTQGRCGIALATDVKASSRATGSADPA